MNITKNSYKNHIDNITRILPEKEERLYYVKNQNCIGYQLQRQVLNILDPFLIEVSEWLTIGDLQGTEANFLLEKNQNVVASDISDSFLKEAHKEKIINDFAQVNVENINYSDNSFDYVFCKEAYHHFPKAYIGLHEMIRCSSKATIIIEPFDILGKMPLLSYIKNKLDIIDPLLINKIWKNRFSFETVGNYVYKVSEREIEKIAMGLGLRCIAFKRLNLVINLNLSQSVIREVPLNKKGWKKIQTRISLKNLLCKLHLIPYNHLCCVIFKTFPSTETIEKMKRNGYVIINLPQNPYQNK